MKGGTSLRDEGVSSAVARSLSVDSCIDICYLHGPLPNPGSEPATAPDWPYSVAWYSFFRRSDTGFTLPNRQRSLMLLRIALRKTTLKLTALTMAVALAASPMLAEAQENKGPPVLRDTETEQLLREYTRPILRAAGLEKQNIQMVIINQSVFNAFVADGRRIFVNYGAILQSETPNQIIGVMAHETGHLAGGHLAKMREQMAAAQTQMIIAMLLGAGAMVAGARSGPNSGLTSAGAAAFSAPGEVIRRSLLSYVRQQEE